jgi:hypothetical protein
VSRRTVPPASAARKRGWKYPNEMYVKGGLAPESHRAVAGAVSRADPPRIRTAGRNTLSRVTTASRKSESAITAPQ